MYREKRKFSKEGKLNILKEASKKGVKNTSATIGTKVTFGHYLLMQYYE